MMSVEQAEQIILQCVEPLDGPQAVETVPIQAARGRTLARGVIGGLDVPHWDNSAMDGYAVRFADVQDCGPGQPVTLKIVEEIPAGYQPQKTVAAGEAARILTGSVMPAGADTVVIQEETQRRGDRVTILTAPKPNAFVRRRGAFYQAGQPLLAPGLRLGAAELAVLAAAQCAQVPVVRRARVAILSTGSELVGIDQPLQPGQIVDSNQYALAAAIAQVGAEPMPLGIVPDDPVPLRAAISEAVATADVVISSGGVSVGDYDYVDGILAELGGEIRIRAIAVRPGKPLTFATFAQAGQRPVLYFGLPGNPVSALVTFWRFVQPALRQLGGRSPHLPFVQAVAEQELRSDGQRETYLWGQLRWVQGRYHFALAGGGHSSGNLINLAGTNGLAKLAVGQTAIAAGADVSVLMTTCSQDAIDSYKDRV